MTILQKMKDAAIRAGLEPWLRPVSDFLVGRKFDQDDPAAFRLIEGLPQDAICVDVGCHKGKFLDAMRRAAPNGRFFAFEPIPYLYELLKSKYRADARVRVFNYALSSHDGEATFYVNERDMGLSGLSERRERLGDDPLTKVGAVVRTLDGVLGDQRVDFIKIDVEGAEFDVLQGARAILARCRPRILFEFGRGGAEYFGVSADAMFQLFDRAGYDLFTLDNLARDSALTAAAFGACFERNTNYNFLAAPRR
ncbi:MAG: FkbM family methyltransferase [Roseiarcus sp.]|jgi:FkbM family methyltransferase